MANYLPSALLAAQARITPKFTEAEMRERQNPILRTGLANQNYLVVDPKSIRESTKRSVKGYQYNKFSTTNGTARSHNFTGSQGDTTEVTLSWSTLSEKFSVYWDSGADNIFPTSENIANGLMQHMRNIRERAGSTLVTNLHAGRTQTSNATVRNAVFNADNDAFEINDAETFFAKMKSVLTQHKYYGNADVIVDSVLDVQARKIAAQGSANGTNLQYSLQGLNIMPHDILGVDVAVSAYPDGAVAIALPQNSFAFIPWIPAKYRKADGDPNSYNGKRFVMMDDTGLPIEYAVWAYTERADGSSNGGTVDDMVTHFQISCDFATQIAEITASNEQPIYEFALVG